MLDTSITMNPDAAPQQIIKTVQLAEALNFSYCYIADQGFTHDLYRILTGVAIYN